MHNPPKLYLFLSNDVQPPKLHLFWTGMITWIFNLLVSVHPRPCNCLPTNIIKGITTITSLLLLIIIYNCLAVPHYPKKKYSC